MQLKTKIAHQPAELCKKIWCYVCLLNAKDYLKQTIESATKATAARDEAMTTMQDLIQAFVERDGVTWQDLKNEEKVCQEAHTVAWKAVSSARRICEIARDIAESASRSSGKNLQNWYRSAFATEDLASYACNDALRALNDASQASANITWY